MPKFAANLSMMFNELPFLERFEAAAAEFEPRIRLGKLDTEAEPELATKFQIRAIPTLILFRGGREIARHSGAMNAAMLRNWMQEHLPA